MTTTAVTTFLPEQLVDMSRALAMMAWSGRQVPVAGRLVEGPGVGEFRLECSIALSIEEGEVLLSEFTPGRAESPLGQMQGFDDEGIW